MRLSDWSSDWGSSDRDGLCSRSGGCLSLVEGASVGRQRVPAVDDQPGHREQGRRHDDDEGGDGTAFVHDPPRKVSMGSTKVAVSVRVPGTRSSARSARSTVHETDVATVPPAVNRETPTDTSTDRQQIPPDSSVAQAAEVPASSALDGPRANPAPRAASLAAAAPPA